MKKGRVMEVLYEARSGLINTQYGYVPYLLFLEKERDRVNRDPDRIAKIFKTEGGSFGLLVDWDPLWSKEDTGKKPLSVRLEMGGGEK